MTTEVDAVRVAANLDGIHEQQSKFAQQFVIKNAESFRKTEILNKLTVVRFILYKEHVDLNEIFLERDVYIPEFAFEGVITRLKDLDKDRMEVYVHELAWHLTRRKYKINDVREWDIRIDSNSSFADHIQDVLDSANLDMPFTWVLNDGTPTGVEISFKANEKNHYQLLSMSAVNAGFDLWFESNRVSIGKKGKAIKVNRNDIMFKKLNSDIDLNNTSNILNVIGGKDSEANKLSKTVTDSDSDLKFNYETTIVNPDIVDQAVLDDVSDNLLSNLSSTDPDVTIKVSREIVDKYKFESGDTIEVISKDSNQTVKGLYKIVELSLFNDNKNEEQIEVKLHNDIADTFVRKPLETNDVLELILDDIEQIQLDLIDLQGIDFGGPGGGEIFKWTADRDADENSLNNLKNLKHHVSETTVDLEFSKDELQEVFLTENAIFTGAAYSKGKTKVVRIETDGSTRIFTFPDDWKFIGVSGKPPSQGADKVGILTMTCFTNLSSGVVAAYAVET